MRDTKAEAVFAATAGSAALAVGRWGAARALGLSWLDSLATWLEVTQAWPPADKATLRMETVGEEGSGVGVCNGLDCWDFFGNRLD